MKPESPNVNFAHLHHFVLDPKAKKEVNERNGWQFMSDMVRATIVVNSVAELWDAYSWFKQTGTFEIIEIKENLTDLKNISIIFDFSRKIIGELQLRYAPIPPQYLANQMLHELERSNDHLEFI